MPQSDLLPRHLREEKHFRWRGGDASRIEALSDAVFAFSLTLLIVALEVPSSAAELVAVFWQFPAFAVGFAFLLWVWYEHYLFHRRYGFEGPLTVSINGLLLFFVLFYVYPLKYLSAVLITNRLVEVDTGGLAENGQAVMLLYSVGFIGIFAALSLLYWRAWQRRDDLRLNAAERAATKGRLKSHLLSLGIGTASVLLALFLPRHLTFSGLVYFLMGPLQGWIGARTRVAIESGLEGGAE